MPAVLDLNKPEVINFCCLSRSVNYFEQDVSPYANMLALNHQFGCTKNNG